MKIKTGVIGRKAFRGVVGLIVLLFVILSYQNCSKKSQNTSSSANPTGSSGVLVSWNANHETAVNRTGGGYKVYYSTQSGFSINGASNVNVPYVSGSLSPTSAVLPLSSGTYYIVVVAYSALGTGSTSSPSAQTSITVP